MRRERGLVGARGPQYFHTWDNGGGSTGDWEAAPIYEDFRGPQR